MKKIQQLLFGLLFFSIFAENFAQPTITIQPQNQSVSVGETATFTLMATGVNPVIYQWYKDGVSIAAANANSYTSPATVLDDDGAIYYCLIADSTGLIESDNVLLNVSYSNNRVTDGLQVLYDFKEGNGTTVNDISGVGNPLNLAIDNLSNVTWTDEGLNISSEVRIKSTQPASKIYSSCTSSNEISFEAWISPSDTIQNGNYARVMTLSGTSKSERNFGLMQFGGSYQAHLRTSVSSLNGETILASQNVQELTHVVFTRDVNANSKLYINGIKKVDAIINGDFSNWDNTYNLLLGSDISNGVFWKGTYYQFAIYNKALSDAEVNQNYAFGVTSDVLPFITKHPVSQTVLAGLSISFNVEAVANTPLSYQWQENGVDISGATSPNYTSTPLTTNDNNSEFRCVVSNSAGTSFSNVAIAYVLLPDSRVTQDIIAQYTFREGEGTVINDVSGVGTAINLSINTPGSVSWSNNGLDILTEANIFSGNPATKIYDLCTATNQITIEAWIKPANVTQSGPARIVTLSQDALARNFTLSQDGTTFESRLRTTTTNSNGEPTLVLPSGSVTDQLQHVVYVYREDGVAILFVNGTEKIRKIINGDFSTWPDSYRLSIANEILDSRPWTGSYNYLAIFNRRLTSEEILHNYNIGPFGIESVSAPSQLSISGNTAGLVQISWVDNSNNEDGFLVERSVGDSLNFQQLVSLEKDISNYSDTTIVEGTRYYYRVKAFNTFSNMSSDYSNFVDIISKIYSPTNLVLSSENIAEIVLSWTDNSDVESGYIIERGVGDPVSFNILDSVNQTNYTDSSVEEGVLYSYKVRAYNSNTESANSNMPSIRAKASFVNKPIDLTISLDPISFKPVLIWNDDSFNELGFVIERRAPSVGQEFIIIDTVAADVLTYTDETVADSSSFIYRIFAYNDDYESEKSAEVFIDVVGVENVNNIPTEFYLTQNYPNPFNPSTSINFALPTNADVNIKVYNLLGQELLTLVENSFSAGVYLYNFDASELTSGVYIYTMVASGQQDSKFVQSRKMILLK